MHCQAYGDLQEYVSQGGQPTDIEAPLVTQYPSKVSDLCLAASGLLSSMSRRL